MSNPSQIPPALHRRSERLPLLSWFCSLFLSRCTHAERLSMQSSSGARIETDLTAAPLRRYSIRQPPRGATTGELLPCRTGVLRF